MIDLTNSTVLVIQLCAILLAAMPILSTSLYDLVKSCLLFFLFVSVGLYCRYKLPSFLPEALESRAFIRNCLIKISEYFPELFASWEAVSACLSLLVGALSVWVMFISLLIVQSTKKIPENQLIWEEEEYWRDDSSLSNDKNQVVIRLVDGCHTRKEIFSSSGLMRRRAEVTKNCPPSPDIENFSYCNALALIILEKVQGKSDQEVADFIADTVYECMLQELATNKDFEFLFRLALKKKLKEKVKNATSIKPANPRGGKNSSTASLDEI